MANDEYTIDGFKYAAFNEGVFTGTTTWMVRRYQKSNGLDDESNYVECLFSTATQEPLAVIREAIANNSWA